MSFCENINVFYAVNQTQLVEFLDTIYVPFGIDYDDLYELKSLSSSEIFSDVLKITYVLDNKGVIGFTKLIEATSKRRMNEAGQKVASRLLYTLKNEFIGYHTILEAALEDIVMLLPIYQENIKKMKEDGYEVVGYTRKSKGEKDDIIRIRLLNLMLEKMKTRSLADRVFVSPNLSANDPFNQRDIKNQ
ncbi:hypothetical protein INT47_002794 [Mucor saturninus]|uniref:Uncharacterized protein n=1 Tax=Mucor saturninus TaxID=64648 RepID=A0A8H7UYR9_9FUNG|nr:hypothetical protein INT47_002794 [Mucor saturninus]